MQTMLGLTMMAEEDTDSSCQCPQIDRQNQSFVVTFGESCQNNNLQDAFLKFKKKKQKKTRKVRKRRESGTDEKEIQKMRKRKEIPEEARIRVRAFPERMWSLRLKFLEQAKSYFGVPYAKKYWTSEDPEFQSRLFLDCCGLVRRCLRDLRKEFGFKIGPWNQAYQYDTLPITLEREEDMKPGDLVFISATYHNPKMKKQKHDLTHVEIWLGDGPKTIGARWQKGKVQVFDHYKFAPKAYHSEQYHFKSIDTWLMGICRSHCRDHVWKTRTQRFKPSKKSVFSTDGSTSRKTKKRRKKKTTVSEKENQPVSSTQLIEQPSTPEEDEQGEEEEEEEEDAQVEESEEEEGDEEEESEYSEEEEEERLSERDVEVLTPSGQEENKRFREDEDRDEEAGRFREDEEDRDEEAGRFREDEDDLESQEEEEAQQIQRIGTLSNQPSPPPSPPSLAQPVSPEPTQQAERSSNVSVQNILEYSVDSSRPALCDLSVRGISMRTAKSSSRYAITDTDSAHHTMWHGALNVSEAILHSPPGDSTEQPAEVGHPRVCWTPGDTTMSVGRWPAGGTTDEPYEADHQADSSGSGSSSSAVDAEAVCSNSGNSQGQGSSDRKSSSIHGDKGGSGPSRGPGRLRSTLMQGRPLTFYIGGGNGVSLVEGPLVERGWKRITDKFDEHYRLKWVECKSTINYNAFKEGDQLVNHIPNCHLLTNKLGLLTSLQAYDRLCTGMRSRDNRLRYQDFIPLTYRLDDIKEREAFFNEFKEGDVWICKPVGLNQGKGIYLVRDLQEFKKQLEERSEKQRKKLHQRSMSRIIQRYLRHPLLINGKKFDIRAYMLIASTTPYLVLYHKGYIRLTMMEYDADSTNLTAHLTNQFVQKKDPNYKESKEDTVMSMDAFNDYINQQVAPDMGLEQDWVYNTLTTTMKQIILYCFNSVRYKLYCKTGYFDLYGLDFMIDADMKIYLIEINVNPSLATNCEGLKEVLPDMVHETLDLCIECFEKSRRNQSLLPLQSLKNFDLLFGGNGRGGSRSGTVSPSRQHNTPLRTRSLSPTRPTGHLSTVKELKTQTMTPLDRAGKQTPASGHVNDEASDHQTSSASQSKVARPIKPTTTQTTPVPTSVEETKRPASNVQGGQGKSASGTETFKLKMTHITPPMVSQGPSFSRTKTPTSSVRKSQDLKQSANARPYKRANSKVKSGLNRHSLSGAITSPEPTETENKQTSQLTSGVQTRQSTPGSVARKPSNTLTPGDEKVKETPSGQTVVPGNNNSDGATQGNDIQPSDETQNGESSNSLITQNASAADSSVNSSNPIVSLKRSKDSQSEKRQYDAAGQRINGRTARDQQLALLLMRNSRVSQQVATPVRRSRDSQQVATPVRRSRDSQQVATPVRRSRDGQQVATPDRSSDDSQQVATPVQVSYTNQPVVASSRVTSSLKLPKVPKINSDRGN